MKLAQSVRKAKTSRGLFGQRQTMKVSAGVVCVSADGFGLWGAFWPFRTKGKAAGRREAATAAGEGSIGSFKTA